MCEVSERIYREGIEEGKAKGRAEGRAEGKSRRKNWSLRKRQQKALLR